MLTARCRLQTEMRTIRKASFHEVLLRFAIGEVNSDFAPEDQEYRQRTLSLLVSGDPILESEGIERQLQLRRQFLHSIPTDTQWGLANLGLTKAEFSPLYTIREEGWIKLTGGTLRLIDAANLINSDPTRDRRIAAVVSSCKQGRLELRGVTLLTQTERGPFTIVEGTARLLALYLCCILGASSPHCSEDLEVAVGLSKSTWRWS